MLLECHRIRDSRPLTNLWWTPFAVDDNSVCMFWLVFRISRCQDYWWSSLDLLATCDFLKQDFARSKGSSGLKRDRTLGAQSWLYMADLRLQPPYVYSIPKNTNRLQESAKMGCQIMLFDSRYHWHSSRILAINIVLVTVCYIYL